ncbi:MAG: LysR family transcriptional regulator [Myxococcales bacterium]
MELDALRAFVKVAEFASFTRASEQLGLSKARVSVLVGELESEVGSRLLQRTTRAVRLTPSGEQFLVKASSLLAEADELAHMFQAPSTLRGSVRVDLPQTMARTVVIPRLPEFLASHPGIELFLSTTDRRVDLVREGFDCVLRVGKLLDSGLVARKLGSLPVINVASPSYLGKYGMPRTLADLRRHLVVHYAANVRERPSFEYVEDGSTREVPMRSLVTVNSTDAYSAACLAGLGIIQAPRSGVAAGIRDGLLLEVLSQHTPEAMPVSLVHGYTRNVPKPVHAVMEWLSQVLRRHLE